MGVAGMAAIIFPQYIYDNITWAVLSRSLRVYRTCRTDTSRSIPSEKPLIG
jgi:hypothetical protein